MRISDNIHIRRAHGTDIAIVLPGGALVLTRDEAIHAGEALTLLADAHDAAENEEAVEMLKAA